MEVFAITIFMSLAFAMLFAALCYAERCQRLRQPCQQMALLPLDSAGPAAEAPNEEAANANCGRNAIAHS